MPSGCGRAVTWSWNADALPAAAATGGSRPFGAPRVPAVPARPAGHAQRRINTATPQRRMTSPGQPPRLAFVRSAAGKARTGSSASGAALLDDDKLRQVQKTTEEPAPRQRKGKCPFKWLAPLTRGRGGEGAKGHHEAPRMLAGAMQRDMIAGSIAGASVMSVLYPLEVVKILSQASGTKVSVKEVGRRIMAEKGVFGFYSGLGSSLVLMAPTSGLYFAAFEAIKKKLLKVMPERLQSGAFVGAALAGSVGASVLYVPGEVVRQRIMVGPERTIGEVVRSIRVHSGVRGFYAGYAATLLRNLPYTTFRNATYGQLQQTLGKKGKNKMTPREMAALGGLSGAVAAVLTTPVDVIKTRLQVSDQYNGIGDALRQTLANEGPGALFKGLGPRVMLVLPASALFFGVYEAVRFAIKVHTKAGDVPEEKA